MRFMLRLLVTLLVCTHSALGAVLNLGVIMPLATSNGPANRKILDAAVAQLNSQNPLPNGHTLGLIYRESNGEPRSATLAAIDLMESNSVVGIIGETYSTTSTSVAPIAEHYRKPMISPSASSVELSNTDLYPYFLRTIPNDNAQTETMVRLIRAIGWQKVAIIVTDDVYGAQALTAFKSASATVLEILDAQTFDARATNVTAQLSSIAASGARIIIMYAIPSAATTVLKEAGRLNLLTKDYAWIGSDGVMIVNSDNLGPELSVKMQGTLGTKPFATGTGSAYTEMIQLMNSNNVGVGEYNIALFDIPLVYKDALRRMLVAGDDVQDGALLLSYLRSTPDSVVGASGPISFDGNDRRGPVPFDIMNWKTLVSTEFESVGRWQQGSSLPPIMFPGNSSYPPTDDPNAGIVKLGVFVFADAGRGSTRWAITKVAIDDFNSQGIIPNVTLSPVTYRQTTTARAILDATAMIEDDVVGVIGPTSSDISTTVASMLGVLHVPQISFSATSPVLSSKETYPYFLRTVASDDWQVNVFVEVVQYFGWNRVGFLSTVESYGSDGFQKFLQLANNNSIQVVSTTFQTDAKSLENQMKYLKDSNIKVIITMVNLNYCALLFSEIFKSQLYGAGYAWIHSDTCSQASPTAYVEQQHIANMPGMLGIQPFKGDGPAYENITEHINERNITYEAFTTTTDKIRADPYAMYNYDTVFAFGYAIKDCLATHQQLSEVKGENLLNCLKSTQFEGYSGNVSFNANGDRLVAFSVVNWQRNANRFMPIGRFESSEEKLTFNNSIPIEWLGGATSPPDLSSRGSLNRVAMGLAIGLGVSGLVIIIIAILLYRFSKKKRAIKFIEAVPWDDSEFSINDTLDSSSEGVDTSLAVSKTKLDFGLKDKDRFPVDKKMVDTVHITNNTNGPLNYKIYSPLANHRFLCKIYPGEGVLKKGQTIQITIECTLLCTSDLEHLIKLTYNDSKTMAHSQYLHIVFEGDISDKLDPDELELKESLGKGAFGTVYRGIYRGREVAIKTMNTQSEWIPADVVEFNKELELMRRLKHLNVVTFVACSLVPNKMCLVTEFCKYGSLSKFMKQYPDAPLGFRLRIALDVAEGVNFLHSNGVLHRDIKPDNVLLVSKNAESNVVAKITDFGTARTVNAQRNQAFNHTAGMGTPIYMAPEILKKQPYNNKVDVFSYGLFLWELISNEEPYNFIDMPWDIPRYVISGKRCPIPQGTPVDIENLIKACWANDPTTRPTFAEIIVTLTGLFKQYHQAADENELFTSPSSRFLVANKGKESEGHIEKERSKEKLREKEKEKEKKEKKDKDSKRKARRPSAMLSIEMDAVSLDKDLNENKD